MNKGLYDSSDEYDEVRINGVFPISRQDAYIINKLTKILVEMEASPDLIKILRDWKNKPEEDILSMLEQVELEAEQDVSGEMKKTIDYIKIENHTIAVRSLFSIKKVDGYDTRGKKPVYKVLINESENINVINGNREIVFDDWAERDICVEELQEKLSSFANIRFL